MEKLKPKSNIDKDKTHRKKRKQYYDNTVVADKLRQISFRTIDQKLRSVKENDRLHIKYARKNNPLLYQLSFVSIYSKRKAGVFTLQT